MRFTPRYTSLPSLAYCKTAARNNQLRDPRRQIFHVHFLEFNPAFSFMRVSQGFWGTREHWQNIEGNKGTLANFWEQGNKIRKITVRKHSERVWEHENIGQF